jgi:hypothetical protein
VEDRVIIGTGREGLDSEFKYVFYKDGIARYPTRFTVYSRIVSIVAFIVLMTSIAANRLTGFPGSYTIPAFLIGLALPFIPVAYLEARRRRRGTQTIEKEVASGFAKLIPWDQVTRIELRPIWLGNLRPGYGQWSVTLVTQTKTYNASRLRGTEEVEAFLQSKVRERLWVYKESGGRFVRVR